ncbi:hypothetical protein QT397_02440 (plasmid) [Microbulbifer sp. MKSA007]|nr:hypothetical protein QT397_02440 [Microbulbifer sp. MKSA007]
MILIAILVFLVAITLILHAYSKYINVQIQEDLTVQYYGIGALLLVVGTFSLEIVKESTLITTSGLLVGAICALIVMKRQYQSFQKLRISKSEAS